MARLCRPVTVTDAMLTSSTVPETVATAWDSATTYASGVFVSVRPVGTTVCAIYVSLQNTNLNRDPASSPTWWRKITTLYSAWSSTMPYYAGQIVSDPTTHRLYKSLVGTANAITIDATADRITWPGNTAADGTAVVFNESFTPIVAGTTYYLRDKSGDTFKLATTAGGTAINIIAQNTSMIVTAANLNAPFTDESKWAYFGPTNRWAMYDASNATVTSEDNQTMVNVLTLPAGTRIDTLGLFNLAGVSSVTILAQASGITRYNQTFDLTDPDSFSDQWHAGTGPNYSEAIYRRNFAISDIPPYDAMTITVTLTGPGVVSIGNLVPAYSYFIGDADRGARGGTKDYSLKEETTWGGITLTERGYANQGSFTCFMDNLKSDAVKDMLERCRATPMLWLMAEDDDMPGGWAGRGMFYGIWKTFGFVWGEGEEDQLDIELLGYV